MQLCSSLPRRGASGVAPPELTESGYCDARRPFSGVSDRDAFDKRSLRSDSLCLFDAFLPVVSAPGKLPGCKQVGLTQDDRATSGVLDDVNAHNQHSTLHNAPRKPPSPLPEAPYGYMPRSRCFV